ncbi:MAG TPA: hypothetical protein VMT47_11200, partial [Polyangia bacterium]|nr:hypothetical protein [Polyangia bacterium]
FRAVSDVLRFDESDLAHNRRGSLSPRQGAGAVAVVEGVLESCMTRNNGLFAPAQATIGGYVVPAPAGRGLDQIWRTWWVVGGRAIWVPTAVFWAVPHGAAYRVYLDAATGRVVSLEPLGHAGRATMQ